MRGTAKEGPEEGDLKGLAGHSLAAGACHLFKIP